MFNKTNDIIVTRIQFANQFDNYVTTPDKKYRIQREDKRVFLSRASGVEGVFEPHIADIEFKRTSQTSVNGREITEYVMMVISLAKQGSKDETELKSLINIDQYQDKTIKIDEPNRLEHEFKLKIALIRREK